MGFGKCRCPSIHGFSKIRSFAQNRTVLCAPGNNGPGGGYFVQFSVVPISLMNGETEGITLLTQYNAHGVFIVLEELGYLLMSLSFLFMAPVFVNKNRLESAVRWVFAVSFILTVIAFTLISFNYGLDRQDRFEVAVISINWLVLIINGVLLSIVFKRKLIKIK
jgi:hypothetical protein